ncbi:MAG: Gfo/Idh/MocA family oxidoreductase [Candidatus Hydrogenedentota bacterium]|nr:MAG: Gfo/Idh/MocA family oxidoreductase [Candidatus Hydrogenedentota bacterium]
MRKLKYGVIGCAGRMGMAHLLFLNNVVADRVEVEALCDLDVKQVAACSELFPYDVQIFDDYRQMLGMDEIDAVIISTPNHTHKQMAIDAFAAGKHVFCEKPLANTLEDCDEIITAAERSGKFLQVGLVYRYSSLYRKMRQLIRDGEIGPVHMMWCKELLGSFYGQWRFKEALSGGAIVEKNCHHFDIFNWMIDSRAKRVCAFGGQNVMKRGRTVEVVVMETEEKTIVTGSDIIDNAFVIIEYENGARAELTLCFFSPYGNDLEIGAVGEEGKIESWVKAHRIHLWRTADGGKIRTFRPRSDVDQHGVFHTGAYQQHMDFADCILTDSPPFCDGRIGRESIVIALGAEKSIKENRIVHMDEL